MLQTYLRRLLRKTDAEILALAAQAESLSGATSLSTLSQSAGFDVRSKETFLAACERAQTLREADPGCGPDIVPTAPGRYFRTNPFCAIGGNRHASF